MHSSYEENGYGDVLEQTVNAFVPKVCVELGALEGFSALAIGRGLKDNDQIRKEPGHLTTFDLFEDYPYRHSTQEEVERNVREADLKEYVTVIKGDAYDAHSKFVHTTVDLLHVDLSNTGKTVFEIMKRWDPRMSMGGIILFEGGTDERDLIDWMVKYDCNPIKEELEGNSIILEKYVFATYLKFPGLTICLKKR